MESKGRREGTRCWREGGREPGVEEGRSLNRERARSWRRKGTGGGKKSCFEGGNLVLEEGGLGKEEAKCRRREDREGNKPGAGGWSGVLGGWKMVPPFMILLQFLNAS